MVSVDTNRLEVFIQSCTLLFFNIHCNNYLRNRKHVPCFYRVIQTRVEVWENEKCCGNASRRRVLLRVLPNFHECFFNSIETQRTCFVCLLENTATKKKELVNFDYQNVNSLCSCHQRMLVLCFFRVIETRFLTNQRAYFLRTVF